MNEKISAFLSERIADNDFPSAVYLVAEKGQIVFHDALGNAVVTPKVIPATLDTIYDLASLTKPLVTGLLASKLIEAKELWLNDAVRHFVRAFDVTDKQNIVIENLALHTSGLPAWLPLDQLAKSRERVLEIISKQSLEFDPDSQVLYSDLNFIVLQAVIEQIVGKGLDQIAGSQIFEPLGLLDTDFNPAPEKRPRIAASEKGRRYEHQMRLDRGVISRADLDSHSRLDAVIWGEVHDGNAKFMGGVAGHAGLFSTAGEAFKIATQFLPQYSELLTPDFCSIFTEDFEPELNEHRSFAFQLASTEGSTAGTSMSPQSFGHNGFTGTSLWIDPVKDRIFILLTNRTHNHPLPFANINSVRRRFHDIAIEELEGR